MPKKERGLGRGLDALFSNSIENELKENQATEVEVESIFPRGDQPRKFFEEESLNELALSIEQHGMLQPVLVRAKEDGYEIVAGERRWRAAKIAGLEFIPVIVKDIDDQQAAEIALIENLQRDDLTVIEEAQAFKQMLDRFGYTQEELAERVGKSRAHVTNTLRILSLPQEILELVEKRKITAGHARALLSINDAGEQLAVAHDIVEQKLSVREVERKAGLKKKKTGLVKEKPAEIVDLEEKLERYLGTRTQIVKSRKGGKIEISYYTDDDLQRVLELLGIM